jgi:hypothetical protein
MYGDMDIRLALAEAILAGRTVSGMYECPDCGAWHLGVYRKRHPMCVPTGKKMFDTEEEAKHIVELAAIALAAGDTRRGEKAWYRCKATGGCGGWHVTSMEQGGAV